MVGSSLGGTGREKVGVLMSSSGESKTQTKGERTKTKSLKVLFKVAMVARSRTRSTQELLPDFSPLGTTSK